MKLLFCLLSVSLFNIFGRPVDHNPQYKPPHLYVSQFENVLGTSLELKISALSETDATTAENTVMQEISRMTKILSAYDPNSEFSNWFKTFNQPVHVSKELFDVLSLFDQWKQRTSGALDASAEVVSKLWKQAAKQQRIPTSQELNEAVTEVKQSHWKLDAIAQTATHLSHSPLVLNSFVKSYIIKEATNAAMKADKLSAIVVNVGGDIVISGDINETVSISDPKADAENEEPLDYVTIGNKAIATSGNYRRGEMINGHWYSHIVDPRTGLPADNIISATVVASNATDAGALATAFNVMTPSESIKLASAVSGAEYLIITKSGERIASTGWSSLETKPAVTKEEKNTGGRKNDFELIVNFEINLQKAGGPVKRPYIAIWVEDENHSAVRTVSVWHGSNRYINELKSWYLKYRGQYTTDNNFSTSISSATRSAGKYSVKWDGKDDKGEFVKPGKYIVKIEVSREHGTYQLMRQEIDWDETPKKIDLAGNVEIASASLDYRKKTSDN